MQRSKRKEFDTEILKVLGEPDPDDTSLVIIDAGVANVSIFELPVRKTRKFFKWFFSWVSKWLVLSLTAPIPGTSIPPIIRDLPWRYLFSPWLSVYPICAISVAGHFIANQKHPEKTEEIMEMPFFISSVAVLLLLGSVAVYIVLGFLNGLFGGKGNDKVCDSQPMNFQELGAMGLQLVGKIFVESGWNVRLGLLFVFASSGFVLFALLHLAGAIMFFLASMTWP